MTVVGPPPPRPPSERPAWLRNFAEVQGKVPSAPLDLPARLDRVVTQLRTAGWAVVVVSIGTDFEGPFGVPAPKDQPLELLLAKTTGPFTAEEAQTALQSALAAINLGYSPVGAWLRELVTEVAPALPQPPRFDPIEIVINYWWLILGATVLVATTTHSYGRNPQHNL